MASVPHHCGYVGISTCSVPALDERLLLTEFYPNAACADEYLIISNAGDLSVNLRHWSISDGEGTIVFETDIWLVPGHAVTVAFNTSSFVSVYHRYPEVSLDLPSSAGSPSMSGSFALSDSGDGISLVSPSGAAVDAVCYGTASPQGTGWVGPSIPAPKRGEVFKRIADGTSFKDTDQSSDWMHFRELRYGYTELQPAVFHVTPGNLRAFVSPDCSLDLIVEAVHEARERVFVCSYELSSWPVTWALLGALSRGVDVRILVDGLPAGNMDTSEVACLSGLASRGAIVYVTRHNISAGMVGHVAAMHAKYLVMDSQTCIVLSENLVEQGVPLDRLHGNRGWGVMVTDSGMARYLGAMFEIDTWCTRPDIVLWSQDARYDPSPALKWLEGAERPQGTLCPFTNRFPADVMVTPSPDASLTEPFLLPWLREAAEVLVEQFQADLFWSDRWTGEPYVSPFVSSLLDAARRNAHVRMLLDSTWFNMERNSEVVRSLSENTTSWYDRSSFRLTDPRNPVGLVHNKGLVMNSRFTVVSSNNWVSASFARNRELAAIVSSEEISRYFESAFELDWSPDLACPTADAGPEIIHASIGEDVTISSNRSWDDRALESVAWDIDCDGTIDSKNGSVVVHADSPGVIEVRLEVTDSWGNSASDTVSIIVQPGSLASVSHGSPDAAAAAWTVPLGLAIALVVVKAVRRRRTRIRKVNHGPSS